jgi:tRNA modification GTPase
VSDTIAAIATAPGVGGVGIVRLSGPDVPRISVAICGDLPRPRYAAFRDFLDDSGFAVDQGLALFFPAPSSFTGEDVLELHAHGGPVVLDLLLARVLSLGTRLARPGEFTERAFLNGKLDLAQAEAVADLIEASTARGAQLAMRSLQGAFSERIGVLVDGLVEVRSYLEATLDFPDDELGLDPGAVAAERIAGLVEQTRAILDLAQRGERIRSGLVIAIAGPPNAGKSSLLNALSQLDAAIVTPVPGTTRDLLKVDVQIDGLPVCLVDTAGLRSSDDPVEREGIRRARAQVERSDRILWVYDATQGLDAAALQDLPTGVPLTLVCNKIDLLGTGVVGSHPLYETLPISALTGLGLAGVRDHLKETAGVGGTDEGGFVARRRHLDALERGLGFLEQAASALGDLSTPELAAADLLSAQRALGEITGEVTPDDLLERIFSTFCIGK